MQRKVILMNKRSSEKGGELDNNQSEVHIITVSGVCDFFDWLLNPIALNLRCCCFVLWICCLATVYSITNNIQCILYHKLSADSEREANNSFDDFIFLRTCLPGVQQTILTMSLYIYLPLVCQKNSKCCWWIETMSVVMICFSSIEWLILSVYCIAGVGSYSWNYYHEINNNIFQFVSWYCKFYARSHQKT